MTNDGHPRPDFMRGTWKSLDGIWNFAFDDGAVGESAGWFRPEVRESGIFPLKITVPFCYQSEASGIADTGYHPVLWYSRSFDIDKTFNGKRVMLKFGAVDFECRVWVNGYFVGNHQGGYTPFSFDISNFIDRNASNCLTLMVIDRNDTAQPRGKQYWKTETDRCWYTPCSGVWQSIWIEAVPDIHITAFTLKPDIDNSIVKGFLTLNAKPALCNELLSCDDSVGKTATLNLILKYKDTIVQTASFSITEQRTTIILSIKEEDSIDEMHYWSPENPNLYDLECIIIPASGNNEDADKVHTYFGMRKISARDGQIFLNNRPLYQRLVLAQGYWEEGNLTPHSTEAFRKDIELIKSLGFNGVRMHQKIEDPRFYFWADKVGLLVWAEMPSAYEYCLDSCRHIINEWTAFIERDMNHPSIICWVPFNESWGIRNISHNKLQQEFVLSIYHLAKALDGTRLISTNDGWEQVDTDVCGIHDYASSGTVLGEKLANLLDLLKGAAQGRMIYAEGFAHSGEPILITEFGGIAFDSEINEKNWGYAEGVANTDVFIERLKSLVDAILECQDIKGYCYTQFTDLMQEVNGLAYMNRKLKVPIENLYEIFSRSPW